MPAPKACALKSPARPEAGADLKAGPYRTLRLRAYVGRVIKKLGHAVPTPDRGNIPCSYLHAKHTPERACNIKVHLHLDNHLLVSLCEHSSGLECSNRCRQMYRECHLADVESAQISIIITMHNPIKVAVSGKSDTTILCTFCSVQGLPFGPCQMQRSVCNSSSV